MLRFRRDVLLVPRKFGGAFLIDLSGDSFTLPAEQAPFAEILASGAMAETGKDDPTAIPCGFLEELSALSLIDQPQSFRSRRVALLNRLRAAVMIFCLHAVLIISRSPQKLSRRLMTLAYCILRYCSWTVTVETWTEFFSERSSDTGQLNNSLSLEQLGQLVQATAARHFFPVRCKERSLALFALCRLAGHPAQVHVGCCPTVFQLHCWLQSKDEIVGDDFSLCADFNTIATWS